MAVGDGGSWRWRGGHQTGLGAHVRIFSPGFILTVLGQKPVFQCLSILLMAESTGFKKTP